VRWPEEIAEQSPQGAPELLRLPEEIAPLARAGIEHVGAVGAQRGRMTGS
jgi:hypothetical protein